MGVWVCKDHVNRRDCIYPRIGRHAHGRYSKEKTKIKKIKIPPWLKDEKEEGSALGTEKLARSAAPPPTDVYTLRHFKTRLNLCCVRFCAKK